MVVKNKKITNIKRWIKRAFKLCVFFTVFQLIVSFLNYVYLGINPWYRILWHDFYEEEGTIDNVCLGSSHVYYGINPKVLDSMNNQVNFNLATALQTMDGSYYLLKEADRKNKLSHVYLELYYLCSVKDNFNEDIDPICTEKGYFNNWQNVAYMKNSFNRLSYMNSIGDIEDYTDFFFPFTRYRGYLDDWDFVKRQISEKKEKGDDRKDYTDGNGYYEFAGQGHFLSTRVFSDEQRILEQARILNKNPMGETSEKYLRKIISYCQEKGISITLFMTPIDELELISTGDYDNYVKQIEKITEEYGVSCFDFNLLKEDEFSIHQNEYFIDVEHLNEQGANKFTSFFYSVVSGDIKDSEKYFYSSYKEKLEKSEPEIYGIYYRDSVASGENPEQIRNFSIAANRDKGIEYQIVIISDNGEKYVLQDFKENKEFELPISEQGTCVIVSRKTGDRKVMQTLKIDLSYER